MSESGNGTKRAVCRISCFLHSALFSRALDALKENAICNVFQQTGRMSAFADKSFWRLLSQRQGVSDQPIVYFHFYVSAEFELPVLTLLIKTCRLDIPGRGSVFSECLNLLAGNASQLVNQDLKFPKQEEEEVKPFQDLIKISVILPKGQSDGLVPFVLKLGIVPTVVHGIGTGIRDRLGILRVALPREKDIVTLVVGKNEADFISDRLIDAASLDHPGKGFIFQAPLSKGVINFKTSNQAVGHAASMDQIIAAIDDLKGNFNWRQGTTGLNWLAKRDYMSGLDVSIFLKGGVATTLSKKAMSFGVTGATILSPKVLVPSVELDSEKRVLPELEVCSITLEPDKVEKLVTLSRELNVMDNDQLAMITCSEVPMAFTYRR